MYPIEREDYVNAYIGAITAEMQDSGFATSTNPEPSGTLDRSTRVVAEKLTNRRSGAARPASPLATH
ncbi:MAG: hypothetical protein U9R51_06370 [Actinomycetota bacterium]|nr:hypothetical protein [Actinomycetota bacterium]